MDTDAVLRIFKTELKNAKISYRDLAREMRMSEAGIKKLFSRRSLTLERTLQIAKVLNVSLAEILEQADRTGPAEKTFNAQQAHFFLKNPAYFRFFMKLAYEQKTPVEIQREHVLTPRSLQLYLKKLEDLGLIRRHPRDRAQILGGIPAAVSTRGTQLENVKFKIARELLEYLELHSVGHLSGASLLLTESESDELLQKWSQLVHEASARSNRNRRARKKGASPLSIMALQVPVSMFREVPNL